jgi:maltose O-acetyltransferase
MNEWTKMVQGYLYDPLDPELCEARARARRLLGLLNGTTEDERDERARLFEALIPMGGAQAWVEPPFYCDYGTNITLGDKVFFNFGCVVLDVAPVTFGSRVLVGPNVQVYAASHPMSASQRRLGLELGRPIEVGDDVWIGGGAILCAGVRVGAQSVIGAGSVVTRAVPEGVFAAGNPCRVIRELGEE